MGYFSQEIFEEEDDIFEDDDKTIVADTPVPSNVVQIPVQEESAAPISTADITAAATAAPVLPSKTIITDNKVERSEEDKKKEHEEAEAKRKAEWEAKQAAKKAAEAEKLARVAALSDEDVMMEAMKQLGADAEKLTRRNMKECVAEYIQTKCLEDPGFARNVMHPKKSFVHCIWHINNKAAEFVQEEMKANGYKPEPGGNFHQSFVNGMYGCDVPDDLVYQWAEEYFNDPNAKEDEEKEDKFVPQPYRGTTVTSKSKAKDKKKETKKDTRTTETKTPAPKPVPKQEDNGQMDFFAEAS